MLAEADADTEAPPADADLLVVLLVVRLADRETEIAMRLADALVESARLADLDGDDPRDSETVPDDDLETDPTRDFETDADTDGARDKETETDGERTRDAEALTLEDTLAEASRDSAGDGEEAPDALAAALGTSDGVSG